MKPASPSSQLQNPHVPRVHRSMRALLLLTQLRNCRANPSPNPEDAPRGCSTRRFNRSKMNILGLNAFHGDASAALLSDGQLMAAVEEERFNRIKHWAGFPALAAESCLQAIDPATGPRGHLPRSQSAPLAQTRPRRRPPATGPASPPAPATASKSPAFASHLTLRRRPPDQVRIHHVEHHRAHLASAFFASPFEEAAVISIDGFGDFSSVMWGVGRGNQFRRPRRGPLPALARPVLHRLHPVPRLPQVRRRVQDDGPLGLRRAALRRPGARRGRAPRTTRSASISITSSITPKASR